jgi:hypothetical protein
LCLQKASNAKRVSLFWFSDWKENDTNQNIETKFGSLINFDLKQNCCTFFMPK